MPMFFGLLCLVFALLSGAEELLLDDECGVAAESCSLDALQRRARAQAEAGESS